MTRPGDVGQIAWPTAGCQVGQEREGRGLNGAAWEARFVGAQEAALRQRLLKLFDQRQIVDAAATGDQSAETAPAGRSRVT